MGAKRSSTAIAAIPGSTSPHLIEVPEPKDLGDDEVLCRTLELGICGTDRDILHSANPWLPPGEAHLILGHECLARVEAVGSQASGVKVGDLVVPVVRRATRAFSRRVDLLPFGDSFIERGIYRAHGFSAPTWTDKPEHLYVVPPEIADVAVFTEPLAVAEKGINEALVMQTARLEKGAWTETPPRVLVTGMGPIAFAAVIASVVRGWPTTVAGRDDLDTYRARLIGEFGASYRRLSQGANEVDVERQGYDLILECTGSDEVMLQAAVQLASCGAMALLGSVRLPQAKPLNVERLMRDALVRNQLLIGCVNTAPRDFLLAIKHLWLTCQHKREVVRKVITHRVTLASALDHYVGRVSQAIKTVIQFADPSF